MRKALNWNYDPFEVPEDILAAWRSAARRNADVYAKWQEKAHAAGKEFDDFINDRLPADWDKHLKALEEKPSPSKPKLPPARLRSFAWSRLYLMCRKLSAVRRILPPLT